MAYTFPISIPDDSPFGLYNLPWGIFSTISGNFLGTQRRAGVRIGDLVIELNLLAKHGVFAHLDCAASLQDMFTQPDLNNFATLPALERTKVRATIIENISNANSPLFTNPELNKKAFVAIQDVQMHVPMQITDYTDSFSSLIHAQNCLHPLNIPLPAAFTEYPMSYNGRLSSITISGTPVVRPHGFFPNDTAARPTLQPTRQLDFEIELAAFIATPVARGTTVTAAQAAAADHIFGFVLLNDWSARDVQKYEMPPLGPFHSKGFLTTISPWIVTPDALDACRGVAPPASNGTDIHPCLRADERDHGVYEIDFSVGVARGGDAPVEIVRSSLVDSYWSLPQQIAYQSLSGHGLHTGDLVAGGTVSSPTPKIEGDGPGRVAGCGCLLEAFAMKHVLPRVGGGPMGWVEDGDAVTIEGRFRMADGALGGFGGVTSLVMPAAVGV